MLAGVTLLKALGHSGFSRFLLELGLPDGVGTDGGGLQGRTNSLADYVLKNLDAVTAEGEPLGAAIVAEAARIWHDNRRDNISQVEREAFRSSATADGLLDDKAEPIPAQNPAKVFEASTFKTAGSGSAPAPSATTPAPSPAAPAARSQRRVFVVHGHDGEMKATVARLLTMIGLEPIILAEQVNAGRTVIEKFEKNADVGYAVVLLSPDDPSPALHEGRARQNVILEWGYFIGALGRSHVTALKKGDVELPSDIVGMVWENYDDHGGWKRRLVQELIEAGLEVDRAKALLA